MMKFTQIAKPHSDWTRTEWENYEKATRKQRFEIDDFIDKPVTRDDFYHLLTSEDIDNILAEQDFISPKLIYKNFHLFINQIVNFYYEKLKNNLEKNIVFHEFFYENDDAKFIKWNKLLEEYNIKEMWDRFEKLVNHTINVTHKVVYLDNPDFYLDDKNIISYQLPEIHFVYKDIILKNKRYMYDIDTNKVNHKYLIHVFEKCLSILSHVTIVDVSNYRRADSESYQILFNVLDEVDKIQGIMNSVETYTSISSLYHLQARKDAIEYIMQNYDEKDPVEIEKNRIILEEYYFNCM